MDEQGDLPCPGPNANANTKFEESGTDEEDEKYLVDDEAWLVIAKQRLSKRVEDQKPNLKPKSPILARIERRRLFQPSDSDSSDSEDMDDKANERPKGMDEFVEKASEKLLDLKDRALQLSRDLEQMKQGDFSCTSSLMSPTPSDQGLVDEILQRGISIDSREDEQEVNDPSQEIDCTKSEEDEEGDDTIVEANVNGVREESQDSLERVEHLTDELDEVNMGGGSAPQHAIEHSCPHEDATDGLHLGTMIKKSCQEAKITPEESPADTGNNEANLPSCLESSALKSDQGQTKRVLKSAKIDKALTMFPDLSNEGARLLRRKNAGLFRWHMPFRHILYHKAKTASPLADQIPMLDDPMNFAPTGNLYAYLERRKVIHFQYESPTLRQTRHHCVSTIRQIQR